MSVVWPRGVKVKGKALEQRTALVVSAWTAPLSPPGFSASNPITGPESLAYWGSSMSLVEDIPLVVWGRGFGKVDGVISCLYARVWGYVRLGPLCLLTPPVSASSIYSAVVCVGGLGSGCYIWSTSTVLSGVLCEFKYALSNSLFLTLSLRT